MRHESWDLQSALVPFFFKTSLEFHAEFIF